MPSNVVSIVRQETTIHFFNNGKRNLLLLNERKNIDKKVGKYLFIYLFGSI